MTRTVHGLAAAVLCSFANDGSAQISLEQPPSMSDYLSEPEIVSRITRDLENGIPPSYRVQKTYFTRHLILFPPWNNFPAGLRFGFEEPAFWGRVMFTAVAQLLAVMGRRTGFFLLVMGWSGGEDNTALCQGSGLRGGPYWWELEFCVMDDNHNWCVMTRTLLARTHGKIYLTF